MQICRCTVAINGNPGMTVVKEGVTVPELIVLRAIHGDDAVRNIEVTDEATVNSAEERERLMLRYVSPMGIVRESIGAVGALPKQVAEAGIPDDFIISKGKGRRRPAKKESAAEPLEIPTEDPEAA